jgi:hypothetical protein
MQPARATANAIKNARKIISLCPKFRTLHFTLTLLALLFLHKDSKIFAGYKCDYDLIMHKM